MVLKLLVFMVAVAVLEGVAGLQEKQFANDMQIKANPDPKRRGRRLDKLPCIMMGGTCKKIDDTCDGIVRQGNEWCLHHRHFDCCYPRDCELNGAVYPNGAHAVQSCIDLKCENGRWVYGGLSSLCCNCVASGATNIMPYSAPAYSMSYDGFYSFSWYIQGMTSISGIDLAFDNTGDCITDAFYTEFGVSVHIMLTSEVPYFTVSISSHDGNYWPTCDRKAHPLPDISPPVYIACLTSGLHYLYIIGNHGISMALTWSQGNPGCAHKVYAIANADVSPLEGNLYGLCDNGCDVLPYYSNYTLSHDEGVTNDTNVFIESWKHPYRRSQRKIESRQGKE